MECVSWDDAALELEVAVASVRQYAKPSALCLVRHESGEGVTRASLDAEVKRRAGAPRRRVRDEEARRQSLARDVAMLPGVAVPAPREDEDADGVASRVSVDPAEEVEGEGGAGRLEPSDASDPEDADGGCVVVPEPAEQVVEAARVARDVHPADVRAHELRTEVWGREGLLEVRRGPVSDHYTPTPPLCGCGEQATWWYSVEYEQGFDEPDEREDPGRTPYCAKHGPNTPPGGERSKAIADTLRQVECECAEPEPVYPNGVVCKWCALPSRVLNERVRAATDAFKAAGEPTFEKFMAGMERRDGFDRRRWEQVSIASTLGRLEGMLLACAAIDGGETSISSGALEACNELGQLLEDHGVLPHASS